MARSWKRDLRSDLWSPLLHNWSCLDDIFFNHPKMQNSQKYFKKWPQKKEVGNRSRWAEHCTIWNDLCRSDHDLDHFWRKKYRNWLIFWKWKKQMIWSDLAHFFYDLDQIFSDPFLDKCSPKISIFSTKI